MVNQILLENTLLLNEEINVKEIIYKVSETIKKILQWISDKFKPILDKILYIFKKKMKICVDKGIKEINCKSEAVELIPKLDSSLKKFIETMRKIDSVKTEKDFKLISEEFRNLSNYVSVNTENNKEVKLPVSKINNMINFINNLNDTSEDYTRRIKQMQKGLQTMMRSSSTPDLSDLSNKTKIFLLSNLLGKSRMVLISIEASASWVANSLSISNEINAAMKSNK